MCCLETRLPTGTLGRILLCPEISSGPISGYFMAMFALCPKAAVTNLFKAEGCLKIPKWFEGYLLKTYV